MTEQIITADYLQELANNRIEQEPVVQKILDACYDRAQKGYYNYNAVINKDEMPGVERYMLVTFFKSRGFDMDVYDDTIDIYWSHNKERLRDIEESLDLIREAIDQIE